MKIVSVKNNPEYKDAVIEYISSKWDADKRIYEDCISHCVDAPNPLPQWYLLLSGNEIIGCAGLITNDFISRMDLYPWLCALFIEERHRGNSYCGLLIKKAENDSREAGFKTLYLCTDHTGLYEKFGFRYIGDGYHPWGGQSRIYEKCLPYQP